MTKFLRDGQTTMSNPYLPPTDASVPERQRPANAVDGYEFEIDEETVVRELRARTLRWSNLSFLIAGLLAVMLVVMLAYTSSMLDGPLGAIIAAVVGAALLFIIVQIGFYAVCGKIYRNAGNSLYQVVVTEGDDIHHTMRALKSLTLAFQVEAVLIGVLLVLSIGARLMGHQFGLGI